MAGGRRLILPTVRLEQIVQPAGHAPPQPGPEGLPPVGSDDYRALQRLLRSQPLPPPPPTTSFSPNQLLPCPTP